MKVNKLRLINIFSIIMVIVAFVNQLTDTCWTDVYVGSLNVPFEVIIYAMLFVSFALLCIDLFLKNDRLFYVTYILNTWHFVFILIESLQNKNELHYVNLAIISIITVCVMLLTVVLTLLNKLKDKVCS